MGVLGLWEVLESVGHPIKVEGLEGKVLGIDANIWLYKFIRGFREKDNASNIDSHKLGLFNRVAKLLYYRIKPVFVFDGPAPVLKRRTLERRKDVRSKQLTKVQDAAMRILANQLKSQYPDADIDHLTISLPNLRSNNLVAAEKLTDEDRDLFYLPDTGKLKNSDDEDSASNKSYDEDDDDVQFASAKVDINSKDFEELPAETRYEILQELKASRRKIRNHNILPDDANSFSNLQLERLKARRKVQEKIEKCEKEICTNYTGELADGSSIQAFRVQSDATATILYRNNTYDPKALDRIKEEEDKRQQESQVKEEPQVRYSHEVSENSNSSLETVHDLLDIHNPIAGEAKNLVAADESQDSFYLALTGQPDKSDQQDRAKNLHPNSDVGVISEDSEELPAETSCEIVQELKAPAPKTRNHSTTKTDNVSPLSKIQSRMLRAKKRVQEKAEEFSANQLSPDREDELGDDESSIQASRAQSDAIASTSTSSHTNASEAPVMLEPVDKSPKVRDNLVATEKPTDESFCSPDLDKQKDRDNDHEDTISIKSCDESVQIVAEKKVSKQPEDVEEIPIKSTLPFTNEPMKSDWDTEDDDESVDDSVQFVTETKVSSQPKVADEKQAEIRHEEESQQLAEARHEKDKDQVETRREKEDSQPTRSSVSVSQLLSQDSNSKPANRAFDSVTNKVIQDAKELLRLFGIPYLDAAGEAEAQCAKLEELKLTEGTITDDSDIWLFGSQNVFRYFFSDDKYVMQYKMTDIEFHVRMTRENLACFAMLVGSDYTDGIMNIGPVTALEILSEFPGDGLEPLIKFRDWHQAALADKKLIGDKKRKKLLKFRLPDEFPSRTVFEGYLRPVVDASAEKFSWGTPELDELREYARRNFGWDPKKVDEKLLPVLKRLNEKKLQRTIDTFFFKTQANRNPEMFRSKRVNQALNKIAKRGARDVKAAKPTAFEVVNLSEDESDEDE